MTNNSLHLHYRIPATASGGSARAPPGPDRRTRLQPGDVVIRISDDDVWLDRPAVVDAGPVRIPHSRHDVAYRLRTCTDLDPPADAARVLTEHGHPNPRLHHDHRIVSPRLRAALLRLISGVGHPTIQCRWNIQVWEFCVRCPNPATGGSR